MITDRPPEVQSGPPPVQKRKRTKRREHRRGDRCLNCFTPTTAKYCPECGQENVSVNISLWEIFREGIEEFVRFDSKLIQTLIPVVFKPGKLTREWATGRRVSYLSPLKLYFTVTAIFFLLLPMIALRSTKTTTNTTIESGNTLNIESTSNGLGLHVGSGEDPSLKEARLQVKDQDMMITQEEIAKTVRGVPLPLKYPVSQLMKLQDFGASTEKDKEKRLIQLLLDHAPTALFAMLPAFAAVLWVLYVRNRRYYVEHLVFALHCHAFYFVLFTAVMLVRFALGSIPALILTIVAWVWVPIYSFVALRVAYGQGWIKTGVKWMMLGFAYMFLLLFAMLTSLVLAAAELPDAPTAAEKAARLKAAADTLQNTHVISDRSKAHAPTTKGPKLSKTPPKESTPAAAND